MSMRYSKFEFNHIICRRPGKFRKKYKYRRFKEPLNYRMHIPRYETNLPYEKFKERLTWEYER